MEIKNILLVCKFVCLHCGAWRTTIRSAPTKEGLRSTNKELDQEKLMSVTKEISENEFYRIHKDFNEKLVREFGHKGLEPCPYLGKEDIQTSFEIHFNETSKLPYPKSLW